MTWLPAAPRPWLATSRRSAASPTLRSTAWRGGARVGRDRGGPGPLAGGVGDPDLVAHDEPDLDERQRQGQHHREHQRQLDRGLPTVGHARSGAAHQRLPLPPDRRRGAAPGPARRGASVGAAHDALA